MRIWRWLALAPVVLVAACAAQEAHVRDGKEYGVTRGTFRGRWWSYYERGSSFLAGEFYQEAEADFQQALRERTQDTWSARTYGLHFVEYFPNRELGITLYQMGRLDEAEDCLRTSLEQIDTIRAHHYLDLIAKKRLELGELSDEASPTVAASVEGTTGDRLVVPSRHVALSVDAQDDLGVESVRVNGRALPQRGSAEALRFEDALGFDEGTHVLNVEATDLAGKAAREAVEVVVDLSGPAIGIIEPGPEFVTDAASITVRGTAVDVNGVVSVRIGDQELGGSGESEEQPFEADLPLSEGPNTFTIVACDGAGNETAMAISIYRGAPGSPAARLWRLGQRLGGPIEMAAGKEGLAEILLAAAEAPSAPLSIHIKFPHIQTKTGEYRKSELRLAGRVESVDGLSSFSIQGNEYPVIGQAKQIEFSRRLPIDEGENQVHVDVADASGRQESWSTTVFGKPVILDEYRMKVAVQHFEGAEESAQAYLRAALEARLGEVRDHRFTVLERAQLEAILQEQQLSASALADPRFASRLGKIRPADVFLYSVVYPRGETGIEILTKAISTETAEILATNDAFVTNWADADERAQCIEEIAGWLARTFPRLPGEVIRVTGKNAWVNLGENEGVRKGMKVVVTYEAIPAEKDPATGEVLEEAFYDAAGWASIAGVYDVRSKLDELTTVGDEAISITEGQPAFTM